MKAAKHKLQMYQNSCLSSSVSLLILGKLYKWCSYQVSEQYDIAAFFSLLPKAGLDGHITQC